MGARKSAEDRARDMLYPERIYQNLKVITPPVELRSARWWLMGYLTSHRSQKVLVICAKAATALQLEQVLREREKVFALRCSTKVCRLSNVTALPLVCRRDTGAQVLLCSEIGSEGRNFQSRQPHGDV
ncbi:hypothetical protein ACP0HM_29270 [Escherichia coli]